MNEFLTLVPFVVYEDEDLLVINKPCGLIVHPKNIDDDQPSLVDWLTQTRPELENVGEPFMASGNPVPRAGVVHRLDKETSGLILIAKNNNSFNYLKNLFQNRKIEKNYLALVYGKPKNDADVIDAPLGRIGLKRTTRLGGNRLRDQKEALTEYVTVKNFKNYTLLNVAPRTGRTHQIRVHLKSINCPIVGDIIYSPKGWPVPKNLDRLFLHAFKLTFISPSGKALAIECDLPEDLQNVLSMLE